MNWQVAPSPLFANTALQILQVFMLAG